MDASPCISIAAELPLYEGVAIADILLVTSAEEACDARVALLAEDVIGFDTEAKPTFSKGEVSSGPHLIQLATATRVYLFPVGGLNNLDGLKAVLESRQILKVGFGLDSDLAQLRSRLGIDARNILDLSRVLRGDSGHHRLGAKTAVAKYFGRRLQKSKRTTTSNWANPRLTERQILYAANDAQVALRVYRAALLTDPNLRAGACRTEATTEPAGAAMLATEPPGNANHRSNAENHE